jgi:mono/diheme cytochrome c family protein
MNGAAPLVARLAGAAVTLFMLGTIGFDQSAPNPGGQAIAADGIMSALALGGGGKRLYEVRCGMCHVAQMGPGTLTLGRKRGKEHALLTERTDLRADYVKLVVRTGLNSMPALTRVEVTDTELDQIAAYLSRTNLSR